MHRGTSPQGAVQLEQSGASTTDPPSAWRKMAVGRASNDGASAASTRAPVTRTGRHARDGEHESARSAAPCAQRRPAVTGGAPAPARVAQRGASASAASYSTRAAAVAAAREDDAEAVPRVGLSWSSAPLPGAITRAGPLARSERSPASAARPEREEQARLVGPAREARVDRLPRLSRSGPRAGGRWPARHRTRAVRKRARELRGVRHRVGQEAAGDVEADAREAAEYGRMRSHRASSASAFRSSPPATAEGWRERDQLRVGRVVRRVEASARVHASMIRPASRALRHIEPCCACPAYAFPSQKW
jgi:hypothetical protein